MNKIGFKMSYELKAEKKRTRKVHEEEEDLGGSHEGQRE